MQTMHTQILDPQAAGIARAGEIIRAGGRVAIPTETVYGLAANALCAQAVRGIFAAKGRPVDNPLIVHIAHAGQWRPLVRELPKQALALAEAFWPGPLTIILEKSDIIPMETSGGLTTIGVRCPAHPVARAVIEAAGTPLAAPSSNLSGRPSHTSFAQAREELFGRVEAIIDGGECPVGVESTVLTLVGGEPRVLRPGGVTAEQIGAVLGQAVEIDPAVTGALQPGRAASSPGMKYRHYAPAAELTVVDGSPKEYAEFVSGRAGEGICAMCFDDTPKTGGVPRVTYGPRFDREAQARELFSALRKLDSVGARTVYAQCPSRAGIGLAVYNRLIRAAGFRIIRPETPPVIGLVGQSGSGKSTVGCELAKSGLAVIDCDGLTRSERVYDSDCIARLQAAFGEDVAPGGELDRRKLAARAFSSEEGRRRLGEITFPRIEAELNREIDRHRELGQAVVLDAPTLFEAGLDRICRRIVAVRADEALRLRRVMDRDKIGEEQARLRFSAQKPEEFYTKRADYVLYNSQEGQIEERSRELAKELMKELKGG